MAAPATRRRLAGLSAVLLGGLLALWATQLAPSTAHGRTARRWGCTGAPPTPDAPPAPSPPVAPQAAPTPLVEAPRPDGRPAPDGEALPSPVPTPPLGPPAIQRTAPLVVGPDTTPSLGPDRHVASLVPLHDGRLAVLDTEGDGWLGPVQGPFRRVQTRAEAVVATPTGPWWLVGGRLVADGGAVALRGPWVAALATPAASPYGLAVRSDDATASRVLVGPLHDGAALEPWAEVPPAWRDLTWGADGSLRGRLREVHQTLQQGGPAQAVAPSQLPPLPVADGWLRWEAGRLLHEDGRVLHEGPTTVPSHVAVDADGQWVAWLQPDGLHLAATDASAAWHVPVEVGSTWGALAVLPGEPPTVVVTAMQPHGDRIVPRTPDGIGFPALSPTGEPAPIRR